MILDYCHQGDLGARSRCCWYRYQRPQCPLQGVGATEPHQIVRLFRNDYINSLGRIHDRSAAYGKERIATFLTIQPCQAVDNPQV